MKKNFLIGTLLASSILTLAAKDPIIMKINNKDIPLSEFEYLYHKNSQQQLEKESLEQYVDRFVVYKLKVADAETEGIDTTKAFLKEFNGYRDDLAKPYLQKTPSYQRMAQEAYERMGKERDVSHIMLAFGGSEEKDKAVKQRLDSIRTCALNGESFEELAMKYSIDPGKKVNHGHIGYITSGRFPYEFEKEAYSTPINEISPVFRTNYGFHIIKVSGERPSQGEVHVEHIMKMVPANSSESVWNTNEAKMDSLYKVVKSGGNFEELAKMYSDDKNSAVKGGELPWFGSGAMVPEFEKVSFDSQTGEISKPFRTKFGVHIVKKLGSRKLGSFESVENKIYSAIDNDVRSNIVREENITALKAKYNFKENNIDKLIDDIIASNGTYDSTYVEKLRKSKVELFSLGKNKYYADGLSGLMSSKKKLDNDNTKKYLKFLVKNYEDKTILEYQKNQLANEYPEYRNLLNEYRDGILLFDISNKKVWDKASRDEEGLEKYFQANKVKYCTWTQPKFKGIVLKAKNDSIAKEALSYAKTLAEDSVILGLHKKFKREIKMERVLSEKGENSVVDELVFKTGKAQSDKKYPVHYILQGNVISQPQCADDVRGQITSDYQNVLEDEWVASLRKRYPVKINKNVLKTVK